MSVRESMRVHAFPCPRVCVCARARARATDAGFLFAELKKVGLPPLQADFVQVFLNLFYF